MDNRQPIFPGADNAGTPGATGQQPYTAAFSQPITSPGPQDMSQSMNPVQMAQPIQTQPMQAQPIEAEQNPLTGAPMIMQAPAPEPPRKDVKSLLKTIAIITLSLVSVTFIGLFIWMEVEYTETQKDVNGQIAKAVVEAVDENTAKLENDFAEREKNPYNTFAGPADYGELTFEYPKTWSVYVAKDARNGGDFEAYFNPLEVSEVNEINIAALRLKILNTPFDSVVESYKGNLEGEEPKLHLDSVTIGLDNNITANRYSGILPGTDEFNGYVTIFKLRDKTVLMQSDSVLFEGDYNRLLSTVHFNL